MTISIKILEKTRSIGDLNSLKGAKMEKRKKYGLAFLPIVLLGILYLFFTSSESRSKGSRNFIININLRIVNEEGKVLSGFEVFEGKESLGRVDAFGEWTSSLEKDKKAPFYLIVKSYLHENERAKRVEVNWKKKEEGEFVFEDLVVFDGGSLSPFSGMTSFAQDSLVASRKREALGFIYFTLAKKEKGKGQHFSWKEASPLEDALRAESSKLGFSYDLDSLFQVYLKPFERSSSFEGQGEVISCGVYIKFPYEKKKTAFEFKETTKSPTEWARKLFQEIKKRASVPYLVKRVSDNWFVEKEKGKKGNFWGITAPLELESHLRLLQVSGKTLKLEGESLYEISPSRGNFCKFPDRDSCYLYSHPASK